MIVYINSENEIKDIGSTTNETFTMVEVPDEAFAGWCEAKILCQKVIFTNGVYSGYEPAVDPRIIEHLDRLGTGHEDNAEQNAILQSTVDSILTDIIPSLMG